MIHTFSGSPLDRCDQARRDPAWIAALVDDKRSRFLPLLATEKRDLKVLVDRANGDRAEPGATLAWRTRPMLDPRVVRGETVLLGTLDGVGHFAVALSAAADWPENGAEEASPRDVATDLSVEEGGILAFAKSLLDWHLRHPFCAACGSATQTRGGGKERYCAACSTTHYPRVDPVVIMLVHDGERCLLGRSARRATPLYSALAGFVEPGESVEEAVKREVLEEAGIEIDQVGYHSSQPWPFPSSLMIGCLASARTTAIERDAHELADVAWFDRESIRRALVAPPKTATIHLPRPIAIAHHLIKSWLED